MSTVTTRWIRTGETPGVLGVTSEQHTCFNQTRKSLGLLSRVEANSKEMIEGPKVIEEVLFLLFSELRYLNNKTSDAYEAATETRLAYDQVRKEREHVITEIKRLTTSIDNDTYLQKV